MKVLKMEEDKEELQEEQEAKRPQEFKTYQREELYTVVYIKSKDNTPISYQRIYRRTWEQFKLVEDAVNEFYNYMNRDKQKLHLAQLSALTGIAPAVLREVVLKMACCKMIIARKGNNKRIVVRDRPYLILQQKEKHIQKEFWGRRCPLYVLPFDEKYWKKKCEK